MSLTFGLAVLNSCPCIWCWAEATTQQAPTLTPTLGHDATSISLPPSQLSLVQTVTKAAKAGSPVVVVMMTATPLDLSSILANPKVTAQPPPTP